jgi:hypothetical protein
MSEAQWQRRITDYCDLLHLRWHHETDSRRSKSGFPDLWIVGNRLVVAELKGSKTRITSEQRDWLVALERAGVECYLWRPEDWPEVQQVLKSLRGGR